MALHRGGMPKGVGLHSLPRGDSYGFGEEEAGEYGQATRALKVEVCGQAWEKRAGSSSRTALVPTGTSANLNMPDGLGATVEAMPPLASPPFTLWRK